MILPSNKATILSLCTSYFSLIGCGREWGLGKKKIACVVSFQFNFETFAFWIFLSQEYCELCLIFFLERVMIKSDN